MMTELTQEFVDKNTNLPWQEIFSHIGSYEKLVNFLKTKHSVISEDDFMSKQGIEFYIQKTVFEPEYTLVDMRSLL